MPDTALPSQSTLDSTASGAVKAAASNGTSWAGWAISSFTNKVPSTKGEIQPTPSSTTHVATSNINRSSSMPRPPVKQISQTSDIALSSPIPTNAPRITRTQSERVPEKAVVEDDGFDAWGTMDEENKDHEQAEADAFFEARGSPSPAPSTAAPAVPFDDGGEPDFAGWLAAQSKGKAKKVLPKGMNKNATTAGTTTAKTTTTAKVVSRSSTPSSKPIVSGAGTTAKPKRIVQPPKKVVETKPKAAPAAEEDDWGEAWD